MATGLVKARWVAGFDAVLNGAPLVPGETIVEIPAGEAEASACWEVVVSRKKPTENEDSE